MILKINHVSTAAFTIVEIIVSAAITGIMFLSLYAGIASGFAVVNLSRENLRANQILIEKLETIRLYSWDQINSNGFVPTNFTAPFFPKVTTTTPITNASATYTQEEAGGLLYQGQLIISEAPVAPQYTNEMRMVTAILSWTNGGVVRVREMKTYVSRDGLQNYIY